MQSHSEILGVRTPRYEWGLGKEKGHNSACNKIQQERTLQALFPQRGITFTRTCMETQHKDGKVEDPGRVI